jgi:hypothetical protein
MKTWRIQRKKTLLGEDWDYFFADDDTPMEFIFKSHAITIAKFLCKYTDYWTSPMNFWDFRLIDSEGVIEELHFIVQDGNLVLV